MPSATTDTVGPVYVREPTPGIVTWRRSSGCLGDGSLWIPLDKVRAPHYSYRSIRVQTLSEGISRTVGKISDPLGFSTDKWSAYRVGDVARIFEVARRKIMNFVEQGVFEPSEPARGRGLVRLFDKADLLKIAIIRCLEEEGLMGAELRARMQAYERRCKAHDFREKRVTHEMTGKATKVSYEFQSPNFLHFHRAQEHEGEKAEGVKAYQCDFLSVGPGFPEGQGDVAASEGAINALSAHHGLLISVQLLHQEVNRRLKRFAEPEPIDPQGQGT